MFNLVSKSMCLCSFAILGLAINAQSVFGENQTEALYILQLKFRPGMKLNYVQKMDSTQDYAEKGKMPTHLTLHTDRYVTLRLKKMMTSQTAQIETSVKPYVVDYSTEQTQFTDDPALRTYGSRGIVTQDTQQKEGLPVATDDAKPTLLPSRFAFLPDRPVRVGEHWSSQFIYKKHSKAIVTVDSQLVSVKPVGTHLHVAQIIQIERIPLAANLERLEMSSRKAPLLQGQAVLTRKDTISLDLDRGIILAIKTETDNTLQNSGLKSGVLNYRQQVTLEATLVEP